MPHITCKSGTTAWVNNSSHYTRDTDICFIIAGLKSASLDIRLQSCAMLRSLGQLAEEAVVPLEEIVNTHNDMNLIDYALTALGSIMPTKYSFSHRTRVMGVIRTRCHNANNNNIFGGNILLQPSPPVEEEQQTPDNATKIVDVVQLDVSSEKVTKKCHFCTKETVVKPGSNLVTEKLCPPGKFYCDFCLRHNFNTKDSRNILVVTFRGIIGYFYYEFYQFPKQPQMWLSEIADYVELHKESGLRNPVFCYDPESYCWFIDFRRVGASKKKITVGDVYSTIIDILASFNLSTNVFNVSMYKLYAKYEEAVKDFYERRYRPDGKRVCIPTLKNCGNVSWGGSSISYDPGTQNTNKMNIEDTRNFNPSLLQKYWSKTANL